MGARHGDELRRWQGTLLCRTRRQLHLLYDQTLQSLTHGGLKYQLHAAALATSMQPHSIEYILKYFIIFYFSIWCTAKALLTYIFYCRPSRRRQMAVAHECRLPAHECMSIRPLWPWRTSEMPACESSRCSMTHGLWCVRLLAHYDSSGTTWIEKWNMDFFGQSSHICCLRTYSHVNVDGEWFFSK